MTIPFLEGSPNAPATGTTSAAPTFDSATAAGQFLFAWAFSDNSASSFPITISDGSWSLALHTPVGSGNWAGMWYKPDCGSGETAPSFSDSGASHMVAQLVRFGSVAASSPLDQTGHSYGDPVTAGGVDAAASDLILAVVTWNGANADPSTGVTIYGSDGNEAVTYDEPPATLAGQTGTGDDSEPFYVCKYGVGPSTLGSHANYATATISEYENYPNELIASFKAA